MAKKTKSPAKKVKMAEARKKAPRATAKSAAAPRKAAKGAKRARSISSWFDVASHKPLISEQSRRLKTFLAAMADGVIDKAELEAQ